MHVTLRRFRPDDGEPVLRWLTSDREAAEWASLERRPESAGVFARWHAEPGVEPWIAELGGVPVAYGEVWTDDDEDEAELARLLVDPERRGSGIGRALVALLAERAAALGYEDVWVRVVPDNAPALAAYRAAGFRRAPADMERRFNVGQPVAYVWMQLR